MLISLALLPMLTTLCLWRLCATALRKMLAIREDYTNEYCICSNATKSKCSVILPICRRSLATGFPSCIFYAANKSIEHAESSSHLGHSFTSKFNDDEDIINDRSKFVRHTNNILFVVSESCIRVRLLNINCLRLIVLYMAANFGH